MNTLSLTNTVRWPYEVDDWVSTGEGGLQVYALFDVKAESCLNALNLDFGEVLVGAEGVLAEQVKRFTRNAISEQAHSRTADWNYMVDAAVLVASTGSSFYSVYAGSYFNVTREDLSEQGEQVISMLEELYGSSATLVTFLDT